MVVVWLILSSWWGYGVHSIYHLHIVYMSGLLAVRVMTTIAMQLQLYYLVE